MNVVVIGLVLLLTQSAAVPRATPSPEPPPLNPGTSSIHGRVIDTLTGKPIEGAEVRLIDTTIEQEKKVDRRAHGDDAVIRAVGENPDRR